MEISRRSLLKTASASGLVAAGLAVSEGFLQPILAQTKPVDEKTQPLGQSSATHTLGMKSIGESYILRSNTVSAIESRSLCPKAG